MSSAILHDLGFFGHYLHIHAGGRGGKQFVLVALDKHSGHLTQRELLDKSAISPAALSEVLSKLECAQLIKRSTCPEDRRQLDIELTDLGTDHARCIRAEREQFEHDALSCFTSDEQEQLEDLLGRLVIHWKSLEEKEVDA